MTLENIKIISSPTTRSELRSFLYPGFGDMLKLVVDLERRILAVGGELHADEEGILLSDNSKQEKELVKDL